MSARADIGAIGQRIRERRMAIGLTQGGLAKQLDVTAQAVSKWETGVGCPDIYVLPDIAQALGITIDELLGIKPMKMDEDGGAAAAEGHDAQTSADQEEQTMYFQEADDAVFAEAEKWVKASEAPAEPEPEPVITGVPTLVLDPDEAEKQEEPANTQNEEVHWEETAQQIEQKITDVFGKSGFGASLSRYINSTVRSAMASAKNSSNRDAYSTALKTRAYKNDAVSLRGLDLDVSGRGDVLVREGEAGVWEAKISAPEYMFERIVCEVKKGVLYVKIPSNSAFGIYGNMEKVHVQICTGFSLGESLRLNVRGSADTKIEPDFEHSEVHVSGSGDVEMANAGSLTYSVSGSGDLVFGDAQDASVRISGSGDAHGGCLSGRTNVHISGAGDFSAEAVIGSMEAVAAGSGEFSVNEGVLDSLKIKISGSGDFYGPNLEVTDAEIRITGGGEAVLGRVKGSLVQNLSKSASVRIRRQG